MKKKLVKKSDGGPTPRQQRLTKRAEKAFDKASAAQNRLNRTEPQYGYIPPVYENGVKKFSGTGTVTEVPVYSQPGMEKKKARLENKVERNINKANKLSEKATSLKKGGSVKKKK